MAYSMQYNAYTAKRRTGPFSDMISTTSTEQRRPSDLPQLDPNASETHTQTDMPNNTYIYIKINIYIYTCIYI